jgi:alcohol dehydrogenase class IV
MIGVRNVIQGNQLKIMVSSLSKNYKFEMQHSSERILDFAPNWRIAVCSRSTIDASKIVFFANERPDLLMYDVLAAQRLDLCKETRLIAISTANGSGFGFAWAAVLSEAPGNKKVEDIFEIDSESNGLTLNPKALAREGLRTLSNDPIGTTNQAVEKI